jgi:wyosine [tRNA(Phe)-imidazoG37] synthetase (radical SAM superfamily)
MIDQGKHRRFADKEYINTVDKTSNAIKIIERVHTKRKWPKGSIDKIAEIQLEPSFPCNLKCPGCLHGINKNPLDTEPPPYIFPYEWFQRMINSILYNDVKLNRIAFVGRGEPTLNHRLPDMIEYARSSIPNLIISMDTNSNSQFKPEYLKMNWINCSIDGSDQDSYSEYRKNGRLDKAIEFMKTGSALKRATNSSCIIRWKYILFNTNDSNEQLRLAQEIAKQSNIDELHFVLTHCGSQDGKISPSSRFNTMDDLNNYINDNRIFDRVMCSRAT